jgi:hypothetical protein
MPLLIPGADKVLNALTRLDHHQQLARAKLHLLVNNNASVVDCVDVARRLVPFWSNQAIGDVLTDRGANPQLRSYLWSYPSGFDWFVRLVEDRQDRIGHVMRAAYRELLGFDELNHLALVDPDRP